MSHGHASRDSQAHGQNHHGGVHRETTDVDIVPILKYGVALFILVAVSYGIVWGFFRFLTSSADQNAAAPLYPLAAEQGVRLPPEPRLQTNPKQDLQDLRIGEREQLTGYHWVDKNAGIVRIPIDEAMRLTIQRGLPSRPQPPQDGVR